MFLWNTNIIFLLKDSTKTQNICNKKQLEEKKRVKKQFFSATQIQLPEKIVAEAFQLKLCIHLHKYTMRYSDTTRTLSCILSQIHYKGNKKCGCNLNKDIIGICCRESESCLMCKRKVFRTHTIAFLHTSKKFLYTFIEIDAEALVALIDESNLRTSYFLIYLFFFFGIRNVIFCSLFKSPNGSLHYYLSL